MSVEYQVGDISLEAFAATEFNEIFLGREPRQDVKVFRCSRNELCPYFYEVSTRNVGKPSHLDAAAQENFTESCRCFANAKLYFQYLKY